MLPFCSYYMRAVLEGKGHYCWRAIMAKRDCNTGLDNRCRDTDGEIRHKRSDTLVGTLRDTYGQDFAKGYRSDAKLDTVLDREHLATLSDLLKRR